MKGSVESDGFAGHYPNVMHGAVSIWLYAEGKRWNKWVATFRLFGRRRELKYTSSRADAIDQAIAYIERATERKRVKYEHELRSNDKEMDR